MKTHLVSLAFLAVSTLFGQSPTDSLHRLLAAEKDGPKQSDLCLQLADALTLAEHHDSAAVFFERARAGFEQSGEEAKLAACLNRFSVNCRNRVLHAKSMEFDFAALEIWEKRGDQRGIIRSYINLALDFYYKVEYKKGAEYGEKALEAAQKLGDDALRADALMHTAANYLFVDGLKPASSPLREKALAMLDEAFSIGERLQFSAFNLSKIQNWRGNLLKYLERNDEALAAYRAAQALAEKAGSVRGIINTTANIGNIHFNKKEFDKALPLYLRVIEIEEKTGYKLNIHEHYAMASAAHEGLGNMTAALEYHKKFRRAEWGLFNRDKEKAMAESETRYETGKKEATIAAQAGQIGQQRLIQWLVAGVAAVLAALLFMAWRNAKTRARANRLLAETNQKLEAKNAENELLLKEIHHRVKNNLQTISSLLNLQSASIEDPNALEAVRESQSRVRSMALIHQKLYQGENLAAVEMKDYFETMGEAVLHSFGPTARRVSLKVPMDSLEIDVDTAIPLGLIANELMTNSLKYAFPDGRPGALEISLVPEADSHFCLRISDNGVGLDGTSNQPKGTGFGSRLVQLLAVQLNGKVEQQTTGGMATIVRFRPFAKAA